MKNVTLFFKCTIFSGVILLSALLGCQKEDITQPNLNIDDIGEKANTKKPKFHIGQEYGGGIIYYIDATGKHGLIAAKEDLGPAPWGCMGTLVPYTLDDEQMTKNILAACNEPGIAARLCDEYVVYETGNSDNSSSLKGKKYDDWFMPGSILDLYGLVHITCNRSFWSTFQTSSTPGGAVDPADWVMHFGVGCDVNGVNTSGAYGYAQKSASNYIYVRPVRKF
jgi:hypothetical protein